MLRTTLALEVAAFPTGCAGIFTLRTEVSTLPAGCAGIFTLGLGLQALDRQVDLAILIADDHNLHILTLSQMLTDVADIGIGHFRNMYHTGLVLRQGNKRTEIGDGLYFSFQNGSDG